MHWTVPVQTVFQSTLRITLPWRFGSCEQTLSTQTAFTGVEVFIGSKVQCLFCFETYTTKGRGEEKGGSANCRTKHPQPLTHDIPRPLYSKVLNGLLQVVPGGILDIRLWSRSAMKEGSNENLQQLPGIIFLKSTADFSCSIQLLLYIPTVRWEAQIYTEEEEITSFVLTPGLSR